MSISERQSGDEDQEDGQRIVRELKNGTALLLHRQADRTDRWNYPSTC